MQLGLKTGMYYLRTRAAADAIKFTVDQQALARNKAARASKGSANAAAGLIDAAPLKVRQRLHQYVSSLSLHHIQTFLHPLCMECRTLMEQFGLFQA